MYDINTMASEYYNILLSIFFMYVYFCAEYENPGKTIFNMCEIASEACQNWFPTSVEKK